MAFDSFLKLKGVDGESTRKNFEGYIEIFSWSLGATNPTTVGTTSGGGGAGKVSLSSFNVMKKCDKSSPSLFQNCCTGTHYDSATIAMNKAGGDKTTPVTFLKYDFEEVYVDSIQWSASSGSDEPAESVSFAYGKVTITYTPQTKTGTAGSPTSSNWDARTVTAG